AQDPFVIEEGGILLSYKTISAIRFNGLNQELGFDLSFIDILNLPEYARIRVEIRTKGSFNEPVFRIEHFLYNERRERLFTKCMIGHCLITDRNEEIFLTPSLKMLLTRLDEHEKLASKGILEKDLTQRYKEFSEIKTLALNANALVDHFTKNFNSIYLDSLPFILGRDCDEEVILEEALPVEFSKYDKVFIDALGKIEMKDEPSKIVLKSSGGGKIFVSMSKKAWETQKRIRKLKAEGQEVLEQVLENPEKFLEGVNRTSLKNTFSDRVSGFIFGRPKNLTKEARKSGQWAEGHDDYSLLIRSVNGTAIPVQTNPAPELYNIIRKAADNLLRQIDDDDLNMRIENESYITPLPPKKDKLIHIPELDAEFNLRTLINTCKRIEIENIPEIFDDQIEMAKELVSNQIEKGEVLVDWALQDNDSLKEVRIPVQSLKSAIPKESTDGREVESISLEVKDIDETQSKFSSIANISDFDKFENPPNFNDGINLYDHQVIGYSWLKRLFQNPVKTNHGDRCGALLADDMGVGKTIQVISLISYLKSSEISKQKPILIVAPVSLLDGSWVKEGLTRFIKKELINIGFGSNAEFEIKNFLKCPYKYSKKALHSEATNLNKEITNENKSLLECEISPELREYLDNIKKWCGGHIILTSYETLRSKCIEFGCVDFSLVVLDEAQKIKNQGTLQSNAARALKGRMYIAMTGTPIENSIMDLYSIMDFVFPMKLGTRESFRKKYLSPLGDAPAGSVERERLKGELLIELKPLWLRRTKNGVFKIGEDLPHIIHYDQFQKDDGKEVNVDEVKMSDEQKKIYTDQVGLFQNAKKGQKLAALRGMLEACHSPWLARGYEISWKNKNKLFELCKKLKQTFQILENIYNNNDANGRKVIIFANVIQVQNSLAWLIRDWVKKEKGEDIEVEVYNGIPTPSARIGILTRFREKKGFQVLVISPRAGGSGLNIQFANHVIHYTREWNPALEKQATDRVYRIGQERTVHVHYPTTVSSKNDPPCAEEELANILASKRDVMDDFTMVAQDVGVNQFKGAEKEAIDEKNIFISANDLASIDDKKFEGFVACLFDSLGYKSKVVGGAGDKGVDVICFGDKNNLLVQAKHTKTSRNIHSSCINEVRGGKSHYESQYDSEFKLVAITNYYFHQTTFTASETGDHVELWDINTIMSKLGTSSFTLDQINKKVQGA
ncbi:MAG: restriction endonuclease, partial [Bacteriovoracaceae bacterium]|nr:restriction endonuclease [Bacteriovoracaceae bacterium]